MMFKRWIRNTIIILLGFPIVLEMLGRVYYFQIKSFYPSALKVIYDRASSFLRAEARPYFMMTVKEETILREALYEESGQELLRKYRNQYEGYFKEFIIEVKKLNSKLLVTFIPFAPKWSSNQNGVELDKSLPVSKSRVFFKALCKKYGISYIDMVEKFSDYDYRRFSLAPEDGHLSRFGSYLVAEAISKYVDLWNDYRSNHEFKTRPKYFGSFAPKREWVSGTAGTTPYKIITNSQGTRNFYDINFPKSKQRILFLGDSITLGANLDNHNTVTGLLYKKYNREKEFINAGYYGYTISDELALLRERAKYVEPDIVVLKVSFDDVTAFATPQRYDFDRTGKRWFPYDLEFDLINKVKKHR